MDEVYIQILVSFVVLVFLISPRTYSLAKRSFDFSLSFTVFLLSLVIFIPIMVLLRFSGEGEIFYFQKRVGFEKKPFFIWKFATMLKNSPNMGTGTITIRNDPRVTKVGKYLRISKLNELPQIINVIKGDMSLVGPRPLDDRAFNAYDKEIQDMIYSSKPGMTGIGSIFFRDEEKIIYESKMAPEECYNKIIAPHKGKLEKWYNKRKSFLIDLILIFLTAWVILFPSLDITSSIIRDLPKFEQKY
ncbi:MAG: lipid carrier--UDP-N-acetylgalactosaminyltransferase [Chloroflexi bacterium]|nr:lipid carrier--UDP-N-acetylgalactosaminyltransferase [Chloroflexota bacterium]